MSKTFTKIEFYMKTNTNCNGACEVCDCSKIKK